MKNDTRFSDNIDAYSLSNVSDELKPYLKELLMYADIENDTTNSFSEEQIDRAISHLNSGKLTILFCDDKNETDIMYDEYFGENPYALGYYQPSEDGTEKIVVRKGINESKILSVLSHEFEHFIVDIDEPEKPVEKTNKKEFDISKLKEHIEQMKKENEIIIQESYKNVTEEDETEDIVKGGFGHNKKADLHMFSEAATEIIASDRINQPEIGYSTRVQFLKSLLQMNSKTIDDLRTKYRRGKNSFIYSLMPDKFINNIAKLEKQLYGKLYLKEKEELKEQVDLLAMDNTEYARKIMLEEISMYIGYFNSTKKYKHLDYEGRETITKEIYEIIPNIEAYEIREIERSHEMNIRRFVYDQKDNYKTSEELINKLKECYNEYYPHENLSKDKRKQLTYVRAFGLVKNLFNEPSEKLDDLLTEFENRLIHQEKIKNNDKKIKENIGDIDYVVYNSFENYQEHFVYLNGVRFLDKSFDEHNTMRVKLYKFDEENVKVICTTENGVYKYEDVIEFGDPPDRSLFEVYKEKKLDERTESELDVNLFKSENFKRMQEIFEEIFEPVINLDENEKNEFGPLSNMVNDHIHSDEDFEDEFASKNKESRENNYGR